jgi:hypothetical protein
MTTSSVGGSSQHRPRSAQQAQQSSQAQQKQTVAEPGVEVAGTPERDTLAGAVLPAHRSTTAPPPGQESTQTLALPGRPGQPVGRQGFQPGAVPALTAALESEQEYTKEAMAAELGNIGPAAKEAVPALQEALNDEYSRDAAKEALE